MPGMGITALTGPATPPWSPASASEGFIFLNGDTLGGTGNVSTWANTAASGSTTNDFATASPTSTIVGATATINGIAGCKVCRFNTPLAALAPAGSLSGTGASGELWAVLKQVLPAGAGWFSSLGSVGSSFYPFSDGNIYDTFATNARKNGITPGSSLTVFHVLRILSVAGGWTLWINDVQAFTTASNTVAWPASGAARIGGSNATTMQGDIAMVFVGSTLAAGTRTLMRAYIDAKYGFSL